MFMDREQQVGLTLNIVVVILFETNGTHSLAVMAIKSARMYGDSSAFLFRLEPDFSIYETIGLPNNQNYQYLNISVSR